MVMMITIIADIDEIMMMMMMMMIDGDNDDLYYLLFFSAFVGSAALGMTWFASPLAGYFCDRFGCRVTTFLGGVLCMTGLVTASFVESLTQMYFTHSLVFGLGTCFIYNACFLVAAKYFKEKLSVTTGIVAVGSSLGVIYTGPLLQVLLDAFEWRGTFRYNRSKFLSCLHLEFDF